MKYIIFLSVLLQILNGVADNIINLKDKNGEQLLYDAFCVLTSQEIKVEYNDLMKGKNDDGEEEEEQKQLPICKLVKHVFSAVHKKEIIETIIPICCKLKKKLLAENKKLMPHLHKFIRELVKDYKSEINELFKEDKQFGIEILHELDKSAIEVEEEEEEDEEMMEVLPVHESSKSGMGVFVSALRKERTDKMATCLGNLSSIQERNSEDDSEKQRTNQPPNTEGMVMDSTPSGDVNDGTPRKGNRKSIDKQTVEPNNESVRHNSSKAGREDGKTEEDTNSSRRKQIGESRLRKSLENCEQKNKRIVENGEKSKKIVQKRNSLRAELLHPHLKTFNKNHLQEEKNMTKVMNKIVIPPSSRSSIKSRKNSMSKSMSQNTPTSVSVYGSKKLLTSTPLITIEKPNFDVDMSSLMNETDTSHRN